MIVLMINSIDNDDDREFMTWLYKEYRLLMFSVAGDYCTKQEDKEDLIQTCMERLMGRIDKLRSLSRCALPAYLVITIKNTFYTQHQREQRGPGQYIDLEEAYAPDRTFVEDFAATVIEGEYNKEVVLRVWELLSEEDRNLLEGKYILELSDAEIAKTVNCKPNSVRMKLTRARRNACGKIAELTEAGVI